MTSTILACASATPAYRYRTEEVVPYLERWLGGREAMRSKALKVLRSAQIARRSSVVDIETVFSKRSFAEKNSLYQKHATELGAQALERALERSGLAAEEIDCLITVSCTGYMIPSLDAYLINRYHMKQAVHRLPVLQMGCAGGTSGLIYADDFLRAHPGTRAAVLAVELPTLTLRLDDLSMANVISCALFADGAACAILTGERGATGPAITGKEMYHFPNATGLMGYTLTDSGFQIVLDRSVPQEVSRHLEQILLPFLERHGVAIEDVAEFLFHPGSIRILESAARILAARGKNLDHSQQVLREHGNMSSATVLYILERALAHGAAPGALALMLAFGPGFAAQTLLLEWC